MTSIDVTPDDVRAYAMVEADPLEGQYRDELLDSYIDTALAFLQTRVGRQIEAQDFTTRVLSTRRALYRVIPDARSIDEVRLDGKVLGADDYRLVPDTHDPTMSIAIALRRNPRHSWYLDDLELDGSFGWDPTHPEQKLAIAVMAYWIAKTPDAVLGGVIQLGETAVVDISRLPGPVWNFIKGWDVSPAVGR